MNVKIRQEQLQEYEITETVVKEAFANVEYSDKTEHLLVSRLRHSDAFIPQLSLVAIDSDSNNIIGHILLSKIKISNDDHSIESLALAPVSVMPEYQNRGIGSLLISNALEKAKELGHKSVVVLGHPDYYPKFGFRKASFWNIKPPFEVPDEAFMALELSENVLTSGVVEYPAVFFE